MKVRNYKCSYCKRKFGRNLENWMRCEYKHLLELSNKKERKRRHEKGKS